MCHPQNADLAQAVAARVLELLQDRYVAPAVLTTEQAAAYLSVPPLTLVEWRTERRAGFGPKVIKKGGFVRYRKTDLDAWLAANVREDV